MMAQQRCWSGGPRLKKAPHDHPCRPHRRRVMRTTPKGHVTFPARRAQWSGPADEPGAGPRPTRRFRLARAEWRVMVGSVAHFLAEGLLQGGVAEPGPPVEAPQRLLLPAVMGQGWALAERFSERRPLYRLGRILRRSRRLDQRCLPSAPSRRTIANGGPSGPCEFRRSVRPQTRR